MFGVYLYFERYPDILAASGPWLPGAVSSVTVTLSIAWQGLFQLCWLYNVHYIKDTPSAPFSPSCTRISSCFRFQFTPHHQHFRLINLNV
jgi:hypothetical protein